MAIHAKPRMMAMLLIVVLLVTLVSGCQQGAQTPQPQGALTDAQKLEAAKKEGKVVYGTSGDLQIYTAIFAKFTEKYGIPVEIDRQTPEIIAEKVASEAAGNRSSIDLIHISGETMVAMYRDGYLADFSPKEAAIYPDPLKFGKWGVAVRQLYMGVVYNTNLVKGADLASLTDITALADPKWKGKIAMEFPERGTGGGFRMLYTIYKVGRIDRAFLEALYKNQPIYGVSATPLTTMLVAGDFAVYVTGDTAVIDSFKAKGAPVDWLKGKWQFVTPMPAAINSRAPHRYAAELAYNYLLSEEAQKQLADLGEVPSHPNVKKQGWPVGYNPELVPGIVPNPEEAKTFTNMLIEIFHR